MSIKGMLKIAILAWFLRWGLAIHTGVQYKPYVWDCHMHSPLGLGGRGGGGGGSWFGFLGRYYF